MIVSKLEEQLKQGKLDSIYLLYGKETYLIENTLKKIKKLFGNLSYGLNYIKIENEKIGTVIQELQTPAFGFDKKLIILRDTELLKKQTKKKSADVQDKIERLAKYIEENTENIKNENVIVFVEEDIEKNELYKIIEKVGIICNFEAQKPAEIQSRLRFIFKAYSVEIDNYTLSYFIESCGTNLQDLMNETQKLIEYAGSGGCIKKEDIDALCIKQFESVIFDLTDSIGQKNVGKSLEVLRNLIYAKEPVQKILVTLYNHLKKLYMVKLCVEGNKDVAQYLRLKANQMFLVSKYKRQASYFKTEELKNILFQFVNLDEESKNGSIDLNLGLESVICGYCS